MTLDGSDVTDNAASSFGGGAYITSNGDLVLSDTWIGTNSVLTGAGGGVYMGSGADLTCTGAADATSGVPNYGIVANSASVGGGVYVAGSGAGSGSIYATDCDFGPDGGGYDNTPDDFAGSVPFVTTGTVGDDTSIACARADTCRP
jgi:hypothetical protein